MKSVKSLIALAFIALLPSAGHAQAFWWPPVVSRVSITLRATTSGYTPVKFNYTLTHLGSVLYQASLPLTPSHHSLVAAGNQYQAHENMACNTATTLLPHPLGNKIKVERVNYYLLMPGNTRQIISKTQTDCP